ncbi:MAG: hypothetical protein IPN68_09235 [Bacteroidetes bacterium]|nr:hypothetical protein [Bacteroidota bacterium]
MTNYTWTVSAGGSITAGSTSEDITVTWSTVGAKTVTVTYTDGNGCNPASPTSKTVNVNPIPVPTISGPNSVCETKTGNIYTTEASKTSYTWAIPAGGTITGGQGTNTATVTWNMPGAPQTINVTYISNGCPAAAPTVYDVTVVQTHPFKCPDKWNLEEGSDC